MCVCISHRSNGSMNEWRHWWRRRYSEIDQKSFYDRHFFFFAVWSNYLFLYYTFSSFPHLTNITLFITIFAYCSLEHRIFWAFIPEFHSLLIYYTKTIGLSCPQLTDVLGNNHFFCWRRPMISILTWIITTFDFVDILKWNP